VFHLATPNRIYHYIGLVLMGVHLSLFLFGLPNFQYGIWNQTEPVQVALYALTMLACIWLAVGIARGWLEMQPLHPMLVVLLGWIGWQV
jgi:hypothetical protein